VVVAIDAKRRDDNSGWDVYINGGRINTGKDAVEWAVEVEKLGAGEILLTSMDCDGTKKGYDIELMQQTQISGISQNRGQMIIALYLSNPQAYHGMNRLASTNIMKKSGSAARFYYNLCKLLRLSGKF